MSTKASAPEKPVRPFGWRDKIGYMFGDFGNDFSFILQMMFFMLFYTDIMGINAATVGTLFLAARVVDAFTDIGMGRLIDILRPTKNGRFRPWIARMAVPVALASTAMYMPFVVDASYTTKVVYMCVTYVIWGSVFYTSINIPYGSMAAVISNEPEHRSSLSVFRAVGAQMAFLIISAALPQIVYSVNDLGNKVLDPTRMAFAAIGCATLSVVCYMLCYGLTQERVRVAPAPKGQRQSFGKLMKSLASSRPLLSLVAGALCALVAGLVATGVTPYLWKDYFGQPDKQSLAQIIAILPVFAMATVATWLGAKWGKKEIMSIILVVSGAISVFTWMLGVKSVPLFLVLFFFISLGNGFFNTIIWAIVTDVLDYQDVVNGERDDATVYAIYSWARKVGQALAGGISGWAISGIGYDSELAKQGIAQSEHVLNGIYMLMLLVPGLLYICTALIFWFWYPLSKARVEENTRILEERRANKALEKGETDHFGPTPSAAGSPFDPTITETASEDVPVKKLESGGEKDDKS